jgi:5,10-methenyltetrahydromethanopterin hydrogenase
MGHKLTLAAFVIDLGGVDSQKSNPDPVFEKNGIAVIDEYDPVISKGGQGEGESLQKDQDDKEGDFSKFHGDSLLLICQKRAWKSKR